MNIPLHVTPESMAAWLATPEWEFFKAVMLEEIAESRQILENVSADQAAIISAAQGKIAVINKMLSKEFGDMLVAAPEVEAKRDGGQSILFSLKLYYYRQSKETT